jgi:hypothetical protein
MFATTQKSVSMILGVALSAAATFAAPVFAGEASLAHNEIAAQNAIVGTVDSASASTDASPATLARNEALAQRVIVDVSTPSGRVGAIGEATLTQNEIAAQRAIVDASVANRTDRSASSAKTSVTSTRSPAGQ